MNHGPLRHHEAEQRNSQTRDCECRPVVVQVGILKSGPRSATMRSAVIFLRLAECAMTKNLYQHLLLLITGEPQKELARSCGVISGKNP